MDAQERRSSPRLNVEGSVRVLWDGGSLVARLKSLSRLGALFESEHTFPVGTRLNLEMDVPGTEEVLLVLGQVVRSEGSEGHQTVAVMFAPLTPSAHAKLDIVLAP